MNSDPTNSADPRELRWREHLAWLSTGLLLFETLTGLMIYLLPFSVTTQFSVLIHTVIGVPFVVPMTWYSIRHWLDHRATAMNHYKATGYALVFAILVCNLSGLVLTWQAFFTTRISYYWDAVHVVSTFATIAFFAPHVGLLLLRERKRSETSPVRRAAAAFQNRSLGAAGLCFAILLGTVLAYSPPEVNDTLPDDYAYMYGEDRPFAPSLATTATGGAYDQQHLSGSMSCGTSNCHEQITEEWAVSAHRWASMDPAFQAVQKVMAEQNGAESTRYCGGCHDPISLFSGTKNIFTEDLSSLHGYQEGISCLACHGIQETDIKGNANYMIEKQPRYLWEVDPGPVQKFLSDGLIRAYPWTHTDTLGKKLFKTPEYCAACHKQFIDAEVNQVGWVQLQNQFDNWRKSRWNHPGEPEKTIECRECHMPLVASRDPASGDELDYNRDEDDGMHRSHRFLGANQLIPEMLELDGAAEQIRLTEEWLRGELPIPEIAHKWKEGPAVPIELEVPERVKPGEDIQMRVNITSNKVGHDFPTGPLDIIQAWIDIKVTDDAGKEVFHSGELNERNFIEPGTFMFKAEAVDRYGNLIDRHNLWEMVGVRYRRSLFPGFADAAEFSFGCPSFVTDKDGTFPEEHDFSMATPEGTTGKLHVEARLRYRKIDQFLLNYLFGEDTTLTSRVTDVSRDEATIIVSPE